MGMSDGRKFCTSKSDFWAAPKLELGFQNFRALGGPKFSTPKSCHRVPSTLIGPFGHAEHDASGPDPSRSRTSKIVTNFWAKN